MSNLKILIERGYSDGRLDLSDGDYTCARRSDNITWEIKKGANVRRIADISEKESSDNIFVPGHPHRQNERWTGNIRNNVPDGAAYRYNIFWINELNQEKKHDPIISVRPSRGIEPMEIVLIAVTSAIVGIFAYRFWLHYHNKRKHQESKSVASI